MNTLAQVLLIVLLMGCALAGESKRSQSCSVSYELNARPSSQGGSWTQNSINYQIYDLTITNNGEQNVYDVELSITLGQDQSIYESWNLESKGDNLYELINAYPLEQGIDVEAGFVVSSANDVLPTVDITSVSCVSQSPSPTQVSKVTPTPTQQAQSRRFTSNLGCDAGVIIEARSAANKGVWKKEGVTYQVFDVTISNEGQRPINGGAISFVLSSDAAIAKYWQLYRQEDTSDFNIAFTYGPLQVGAELDAGIVVAVPGSSGADVPGYSLTMLSCQ